MTDPSTRPAPPLSVILCTYNPRADLIARALRAVSAQTLSTRAFELIVVDNNSNRPLDKAHLERLAGRELNLVVEKRQGLTFARVGGINQARAQTICFIDDDNELDPDYLKTALAIGEKEPELGVWGGVADGVLEKKPGRLVGTFLPYLGVRNIGAEPQTGAGDEWGPWEPIGAGICLRRDVALGYVDFVENTKSAGGLGRTGGALLSGEDSLISRIAHRLGYKGGYRPNLRLRHHITAPRLNLKYIARLMEGHGRSYVILEAINGRAIEPVAEPAGRKTIVKHFAHRLKAEGFSRAIGMAFWDIGYFRQSRDQENPNPGHSPLDRIGPAA